MHVYIDKKRASFAASLTEIDSAKLHVIFIHGSGGDRRDWESQIQNLGGLAGMIALELPGHGNSEGPGFNAVNAYGEWVDAFVRTLELTRVIIVGCSLGSAVAQWLTIFKTPTYIKGLVLTGAGGRLRVHPAFLDGLKNQSEKTLALLSDSCLSDNPDKEFRSFIQEKFRNSSSDLIRNDLLACNDFDVLDSLNKISVPTGIIVGAEDKMTPVKYSEFLHQKIADSLLYVISSAGHLVAMEKPEEFNSAMRDYMTKKGFV
jgi:pimeloyl-ACP methyl ester carboxylesterase